MPSTRDTCVGKTIRRLATVAACLVVGALVGPASALAASSSTTTGLPSKEACVYSQHQVSILQQFSQMVGRQINCAMVFANTATTWTQWENPWFINYYDSDLDWSQWATTPGTNRSLVITLSLIPSNVEGQDWLDQGAAGDYEQYAQTLAANLVAAGLGSSIIRLAPEMNGSWYPYSLGTTQAQWAQWDQFWTNTVEAMRSVPGANFKFDWCIAALWRPLPLSEIYPGNNVVDIIGVDAYDTGNLGTTAAARWNRTYNGPDGIGAVLSFARSQGKPVSIPEWGVTTTAENGFGDDPTFVNGIASVVKNNPVVYQSYFYKYGQVTELAPGTQSLAAYRLHFGANGDSVDTGTDTWPLTTASSSHVAARAASAGHTSAARSAQRHAKPRRRHARAAKSARRRHATHRQARRAR
jgi:beta-mannanase